MKHKDFNKFGGTEFRVKDQIAGYVVIINWILEYQKSNDINDISIVEKAFRKYCLEENLYQYKNDKKSSKIIRFKMIFQNLEKDLHILQLDKNENKYVISENFDFKNASYSFLYFMQNAWRKRNFPFKQMLKFMYENKSLNDAKKLRHAFMVYDGKESFDYLYSIDVINQIIDNEFSNFELSSNFSKFIKFRKPPKAIKIIKKIYKKKYLREEITKEDSNEYEYKTDKYLKKIIFNDSNRQVNNPNIFVKNLNRIDAICFLKRLRKVQLETLLDGDYCDLFNRWLYGIGLVHSSSKNEKTYLSNRLDLKNEKYIVNIQQKKLSFPFTLEKCIEILKKIQLEEYTRIKIDCSSLCEVPNSAIAEYFVNLFFCYKLGITPTEFKEYVNTQVNDKLLPVFSARGGMPDMWYKKQDCIYCVETTMIKNNRQIYMSESIPCSQHLYNLLNENKINFNNNSLYFINYHNDEKFAKEIHHVFNCGWNLFFLDQKTHFKLNLINYSFDDLTKLQFS